MQGIQNKSRQNTETATATDQTSLNHHLGEQSLVVDDKHILHSQTNC